MTQSVMEVRHVHGSPDLIIHPSIRIVVFCGMYGAGKDYAKQALHDMCPSMKRVPSHTTRAPRPGDRGYLYHTDAEFDGMQSHMIWQASSPAGRYGTLYSDLDDALRQDATSTLDVKHDCLPKLQAYADEKCMTPGLLSLLVVCWDRDVVERRIRARDPNIPNTEVVKRMDEFDDQTMYARSGLYHGMITSRDDKTLHELRHELADFLSQPIPEPRAFA